MDVEFSIYGPMRSASGDAAQHKYKLLTGSGGRRWVVSVDANAGENIYVDGGQGSKGMGGSTLTFDLEDGGSVSFIGPWKTGAEALLEATGYDVRNTYYSRGVVAKERISHKGVFGAGTYVDVLHYGAEPVLGDFDRVKNIAQALANEHGVKLPYGVKTSGGGTAGWVEPKKEE